MTFKEAAYHIEDLMAIYDLTDSSKLPKATKSLEMAIKLLLWASDQPEWALEGDIVDLINEYYNSGLQAGFNRAVKKVYDIKD